MAPSIASLIEHVEEASKVPAKRRGVSIKPTVADLASALYEAGALPDELTRLIHLITRPNHLDQATRGVTVRNLYPAAKVPKETLLDVLGCLGHGELKPSLAIQALLLRWLIMVYNVLEEPGVLSQAYAVLFNLLDTAALRPQLCHLLALVTRRKHVRPFRIQAVLVLSRQIGSDSSLTGLLRVYKNYYPEIIVGEAAKGRAAAFKHPDPQWRIRLDEIQAEHLLRSRDDPQGMRNGFRVNHFLNTQAGGQGVLAIPAVHTLHAQEDSVTLEEIDSAEALVRNLEKIELPSQLVAVLADPLLQKLMTLRANHDADDRVSNWIDSCISDVRNGDAGAELLLDMVEVLQGYVSNTQALPPALLPLFSELFKLWDGFDRRDVVLDVLSYSPLMRFNQLYTTTFQPLEACLLDNTAESQLRLLSFYTALLRRWRIILVSAEDPSSLDVSSVSDLTSHVNQLTLTLSQTSQTASTHLAILEFYHYTASLTVVPSLIQHLTIQIPPPTLVYILHFSPSLAIVSRLCAIVATYKRGLELAMTQPSSPSAPGRHHPLTPAESDRVKTFNGLLMDICNCIWRSKAFGTTDANAQGCRVPGAVVAALQDYLAGVDPDARLQAAFGVSHSPALCLQSLEYVRELEDLVLAETEGQLRERHGGPVTQRSLAVLKNTGGLDLSWQEYRAGVLRHLEERGFGGVSSLMYSTMKVLMQTKGQ